MVVTAAAGFYLGATAGVDLWRFGATIVGVALVAAGTNAFNQLRERDVDATMERTRGRPLPTGRLTPRQAGVFALLASIAGIALLWWRVNLLTAALAFLTLVSYVFAYTPLKRRTSLNTLVGAVPGALPVLGGWTAAGGRLDLAAWALFAILFLWQLPHFMALSWIYRDQYRTAGLAMLSIDDADGSRTSRMAFLYALALLPVSLLPSVYGLTGRAYFAGALALGVIYTAVGAAMWWREAQRLVWARRVFVTSIVYLPLLLMLGVLDKVGR